MAVSQWRKESEHKSRSPPLEPFLAAREVAKTKDKSDHSLPNPSMYWCWCLRLPAPCCGVYSKSASLQIRAQDTARLSSHKDYKARWDYSRSLSLSSWSSPPRKRWHLVKRRRMDVAAPADLRDWRWRKNGVGVTATEPEQTSVVS